MLDAVALRSLSSLLRAGMSPVGAFLAWPQRVADPSKPAAAEIAARVSLGVGPADAIDDGAFGALTPLLRSVLRVHLDLGGDLAESIDAVADELDAAQGSSAGAAAQAAGAKLSARMITFLPLVFIALIPGSKVPLDDPVSMTSLSAGVCFVTAGMAWIRKLLPAPPTTDLAATMALVIGAVVRGGVGPARALSVVAPAHADPELRLAADRVGLGLGWEEAFELAEDEGLQELGAALRESRLSGAPVAARLASFAAARKGAVAALFEAEARRAPVRMVVPLTVCMLPGFLLLGAGPLLRGISG